jgi:hypothetical protein
MYKVLGSRSRYALLTVILLAILSLQVAMAVADHDTNAGPVVSSNPFPVDTLVKAANEAHAREVAAASGHPLATTPAPSDPAVVAADEAHAREVAAASGHPLPSSSASVNPEVTAANEAHAREVAAATGAPVLKNPAEKSMVSPEKQIGSWALVDQSGKVINVAACQEMVCGPGGSAHTLTGNDFPGCDLGCTYVLQAAPNPITGESVGGVGSDANTTVTYKDGVFVVIKRTLAPGATLSDNRYVTTIETIKDGINTNSDGVVFDSVNKVLLDPGQATLISTSSALGALLDVGTPIERVFADAIGAGTLSISRSKTGYLLDTSWDTAKTDTSMIVFATKKGLANRKLILNLNQAGDLVLNTKISLKGYTLNVKVDGKIAAKLLIKK